MRATRERCAGRGVVLSRQVGVCCNIGAELRQFDADGSGRQLTNSVAKA